MSKFSSHQKLQIIILLLSYGVFAEVFEPSQISTISEEIGKVFKNISRAFWVDDVAYSLTDAENFVCLYYDSVASRRLDRISETFQQKTSSDETTSRHMDDSQKVPILNNTNPSNYLVTLVSLTKMHLVCPLNFSKNVFIKMQ
jgi:hypothetical protein